MKSLFGIVFCFLILFEGLLPNQGLLSILQSPELYQHYQQHLQESNGKIGFLEFLEMHYVPESTHKKKPNHCHHLPSIDVSGVASLFTPTHFSIEITPKKLTYIAYSACFSWLNLYESISSASFLIPPRR